jgi:hypothetical protein
MMTPYSFACSTIVLVGLIGFISLSHSPMLGIALIVIAAVCANRLSEK